ncbi:MAG: hypothetical protein ACR2ID_11590 [Chthoniobacterales bacterium]
MNPDTLFDYLDGKLSAGQRADLEEKLMSDAQLRQQFQVAREIHRGGGDASREVVVPAESAATIASRGRMGRRIAAAAAVLVVVNVVGGLLVIASKNNKQQAFSARETQIREQLAASLGAAAQNAMPAPTFTAAEIHITAPAAQWDEIAGRVSGAAERCSGSVAKGLTEETGLTVVVDIPARAEAEFRQILANSGLIAPAATATSQGSADPQARTIVQVRLAEAGR